MSSHSAPTAPGAHWSVVCVWFACWDVPCQWTQHVVFESGFGVEVRTRHGVSSLLSSLPGAVPVCWHGSLHPLSAGPGPCARLLAVVEIALNSRVLVCGEALNPPGQLPDCCRVLTPMDSPPVACGAPGFPVPPTLVFLVTAILVGVQRHVMAALVCVSLKASLEFSCVCWPRAYRLWRNVYLNCLPGFLIGLSLYF